jgi:Head domain of trimeric autotransporter adhesin/Chaperone of endosialidase
MKKSLLIILVSILFGFKSIAQIGINSTNATPDASAMLDVSSVSKGALLPRMTTSQRTVIPTPSLGLTVFDTDTKSYWFHNGANWVSIGIASNFWTTNGFSIYNNNIGFVGIGTNNPIERLHVNNGNVLFGDKPSPPVFAKIGVSESLPGTNINTYNLMYWIKNKAAFRVGQFVESNLDDTNIGEYSIATGYSTKAQGSNSTAMGFLTQATGHKSSAFGDNTKAQGISSTAMGNNTTASGDNSTAVGNSSTASGPYSIAAGRENSSAGESAITLGYLNAASSINSVAIGNRSMANEASSIAIGSEAVAEGQYSHSIGFATIAKSFGSIVLGKFNDPIDTSDPMCCGDTPTDPLFILGNGIHYNTRRNAVRVNKNGNFGIGNINPEAPLHVSGTTITTANLARAYFHQGTGASIQQNTSSSGSIQVRADGYFWANGGGFVATSDARIKNIIDKTDGEKDLEVLKKIEITNYTYKDNVNNHAGLQKKVIAQQVKSIYPIAVSMNAGIIPNLFETAQKISVVNNVSTISTTTPHDFKTGDLVKLIIESGKEIEVIVSVLNANEFTINQPVTERVFVYGKKVNDLHTVDYDALTTLNISASQELLKRIERLEKENLALKSNIQNQINALEAKINGKSVGNDFQKIANK